MARTPSGDDPTATAPYTDMDGDVHWNGTTIYAENATLDFGTEGAVIKNIINSGTIAVTVPSITDPDIAQVAVDTSALTFACAVGDQVLVTPIVALPTNCRLQGAYVSAANEVTICFGSEGGNVTGAAKNFNFLFFDLT
jgi:hypothetical protein